MITKRARAQFAMLVEAAQHQSLCVLECANITTGKPEFVLCAHYVENGVVEYKPLAKLFKGNPHNEVTAAGAAKYKLI